MDKILYYYSQPTCKLRCKFCYARWDDMSPNSYLSTSSLKDLILEAKDNWFNHFWFTSWNPFDRDDLLELLKFLKENWIKVRIDSHGINTPAEKIIELSEYIDLLWIPLDWHISQIHDFNRNTIWHFKIVFDLLKNLKWKLWKTRLKIHTTLTLKNYASVMMMEDLISKIEPDMWTIYRYFPAWYWYKFKEEFIIDEKLVDFARKSIPKKINKTIVDVPWDEIHDKSFLISTTWWEIYWCFNEETQKYTNFWMYNKWWFKNALIHYWDKSIWDLTNREFYWKN